MSVVEHPKLRNVESIVFEHNGESRALLRDPEGLAHHLVAVSPAALLLMAHFNGNHSVLDLQATIMRRTGQLVPSEQIRRLIEQLDQAYLLDSPRFRQYRDRLEREFCRLDVRPPAHAGGAYAGDPDELEEQLARLFTCEAGPGMPRHRRRRNRLVGVLSPHIDLHRGGPTFAWAYKELVEQSSAELFVIFGTAHNPTRQRFSLTRKDFQTPLGITRTDRAFVDRIVTRCGDQFFEDEFVHRQEHSIEFQVVFLQYLLAGRRDLRIVPILVGSFHDLVAEWREPREVPEVRQMIEAVQAAAAEANEPVCFVCGGDLAHIGPRFGDPARLSDTTLEWLRHADHRLLKLAARANSAGLFQAIARDQDRRRVCGFPPAYMMLEAMGPANGRLLKYDQAVDPDRASCVSFASMAFYLRSSDGKGVSG